MKKFILNVEALQSVKIRGFNLIAKLPLNLQRYQIVLGLPLMLSMSVAYHGASLSVDIHSVDSIHEPSIHYVPKITKINEEKMLVPATAKRVKYSQRASTKSGAPFAGFGSLEAAFAAIRKCESTHNYRAINPAGYYGAYQFHPGTWNSTASKAGRPDLVGVRPDHAAPSDQDAMALALYNRSGWSPWGCARKVGLI